MNFLLAIFVGFLFMIMLSLNAKLAIAIVLLVCLLMFVRAYRTR